MSFTKSHPPIVIDTKDGSYSLPHDQYVAIVRNAEYQATLTAATLRQKGFPLDKVPLPRNFLRELGAVLQLRVWENRGLTPHLKAGLPAAQLAAHELAERATKGWAEFEGEDAAPLSSQVVSIWIEQFAWNGQELLKADVVVGDVDEEDFVNALAEFLWTHRHQLRNCLPQKEESR